MERLSLKSVDGEKMMKRLFCLANLLLSIFYSLCAVDFKITEKTKIYDWVNEVFYDIEKGTLVQPKSYFVYDKNQVLSKERNGENA